MNAVLPLAQKMLADYAEFYPYGGYMKLDGSIVDLGVDDPETDHPKSKDLIFLLRQSLQELAEKNNCKAVAVVFDVRITLPDSSSKSDAIQICLEHREGYSAEVFFPYQVLDNKVMYGETFAQAGSNDIFGPGR